MNKQPEPTVVASVQFRPPLITYLVMFAALTAFVGKPPKAVKQDTALEIRCVIAAPADCTGVAGLEQAMCKPYALVEKEYSIASPSPECYLADWSNA